MPNVIASALPRQAPGNGRLVRGLASTALVMAASGWWAAPASAVLTTNELDCRASARVTAPDGSLVDLDVDQESAPLPRRGSATWQGALGTVTHDHRGKVVLKVGPSEMTLGSWGPSANVREEASGSGTIELPGALEDLPPGRYVLAGFHQGAEGRCEGTVDLIVGEGQPVVANRAAQLALAGTAVLAALVAYAARPRSRSTA